jgi:hypothetical protein
LRRKAKYYASENAGNPAKYLTALRRQVRQAVAQLSHCKFNLIAIGNANCVAEFITY